MALVTNCGRTSRTEWYTVVYRSNSTHDTSSSWHATWPNILPWCSTLWPPLWDLLRHIMTWHNATITTCTFFQPTKGCFFSQITVHFFMFVMQHNFSTSCLLFTTGGVASFLSQNFGRQREDCKMIAKKIAKKIAKNKNPWHKNDHVSLS